MVTTELFVANPCWLRTVAESALEGNCETSQRFLRSLLVHEQARTQAPHRFKINSRTYPCTRETGKLRGRFLDVLEGYLPIGTNEHGAKRFPAPLHSH